MRGRAVTDEELDREMLRRREILQTRIAVMLEAVGSMREELAAIDLVVPPGRPMRGGLRVIAGGRA
jgi:hypothetical protein